MKYYLKALRNFANFSGRARRREYWYFRLFNSIFGMAVIMLYTPIALYNYNLRVIEDIRWGFAIMLLFQKAITYGLCTFIAPFYAYLLMLVSDLYFVSREGFFLSRIEWWPIIYGLYTLGVIIGGLAVAVRRLHDVGKSGWFLFILLIPLVGSIWFLVLMLTDSKAGENAYGENPKVVAV